MPIENPASGLPVEKLVAHREWVRRVARALVHDEALADDLEQEVWVEALQKPPRSGRSLGGWLAAAMRHNLLDHRRSEGRRRVREESVARPEAEMSTADLVVEAETLKRVVAALLEVEEPYRGTLLLRFYEDLPLKEVARRQVVPVVTARTRIRRAIRLLRDRFDVESGGDRKAWCLALLPLTRRPDAAAPISAGTGAAVAGGILMSGKALAGVAVVIVGALLWLAFRDGQGPASPSGHGRPISPEFLNQDANVHSPITKPALSRDKNAFTAPSVVVLDPEGRPAVGARVYFLRRGGTSETDDAAQVGETDPQGNAVLSDAVWKLPGLVRASHPEFAPGDALVAEGMREVTIRLERPCILRGSVVGADGSPVEGAVVEMRVIPQLHALGTILGAGGIQRFEARSDAAGAFEYRGLPRGQYGVLTAHAEGYSDSQKLWTVSSPQPVRLVLDRPFRAVVHLRDSSGTPLPRGTVGAFSGQARTRLTENGLAEPDWIPFQSQGDGTYTSTSLPPGWYTCLAVHPGCGPRLETVAFASTSPDADIVLSGVEGILGRVVDSASGKPLVGARVLAVPPPPGGSKRTTDAYAFRSIADLVGPPLAMTTDSEGQFRITIAGPGDDLLLILTMPGYIATARRLEEMGTRTPIEVRMDPMERAPVLGRVVGLTGSPVPHALLRWSDGSATTGADGRFRMESVAKSDVLTVMAEGCFPRIVQLAQEASGDLGDLQVVPMRRMEGRVSDSAGHPMRGLTIVAKPVDSPPMPSGLAGAGVGSSDAEGRVVLPLVPGTSYRVVASQEQAYPGEVLVAGDAQEPFTLVVSPTVPSRTGTIRGRLEFEDGSWTSVRAFIVLLDGKKPVPLVSPAEVRPDGRFEMSQVPEGIWTLRVGMAERVRGELPGVAVADHGEVDLVIPCTTTPDGKSPPPIPRTEVRVQPLPGEDLAGPRTTRAWLTVDGGDRSTVLRPDQEGFYRGSFPRARSAAVWLYDLKGLRAGVASDLALGQDGLVQVSLQPAGRVVVPKRDDWFSLDIGVWDGGGKRIFSNRAIELPWAKDEGTVLLLPAGAYEISVSLQGEEETPRRSRVVVSPGETTLLR